MYVSKFLKYYNHNLGLTMREGSVGPRVYQDSENCGLWLALHNIFIARDLTSNIEHIFENRRATSIGSNNYQNGLYDRGRGESFLGYSCNEKEHARTGSRDEMMAACSSPKLARDIVNMCFKSLNRFPNHYVESLGFNKHLFTFKAWRNWQFQILGDLSYCALRSNSTLHKTLGWTLFPIYYLKQFNIPLNKMVTRHRWRNGYWNSIKYRIKNGHWETIEYQYKNSGDQLFVLRDYYLQEYAVYRLLRIPLIWLFMRKWTSPDMKAEWKGNLYKTIVYNFHRCDFPKKEGMMRNHDFPLVWILE